jgi:nucleotide-binding universal stress UspA family protein
VLHFPEGAVAAVKHIVCPTDLSETSVRAFAHALMWARWYDAPLMVIHVPAPQQVAIAVPEAAVVLPVGRPPAEVRADVEEFVALAQQMGVRTSIEMLDGGIVPAILGKTDPLEDAVLVLGTHGRRGLERLALGSIAEGVLHRSTHPVLAVPPGASQAPLDPAGLTRIVCGVDFSPASRAALGYAASLAEEADADLDIVHVAEAPDPGDPRVGGAHDAGGEPPRREGIRAQLRALAPEHTLAEGTVTEWVLDGRPAAEILNQAAARRADLIVLGAGGRSRRPFGLGSTTDKVVRSAVCPVLSVPAPAAQERKET